MINSVLSDKELISSAQAGDSRAFDSLMHRYQARVMSSLQAVVEDKSDIHDICQDTFLKAFRHINKFQGNSSFFTWLYRIAINSFRDTVIANKRRHTYLILDNNDHESPRSRARLTNCDDPAGILISKETVDYYVAACERLPDELKVPLILRDVADLPYSDIADMLDLPMGTIRSRIHRARICVAEYL